MQYSALWTDWLRLDCLISLFTCLILFDIFDVIIRGNCSKFLKINVMIIEYDYKNIAKAQSPN